MKIPAGKLVFLVGSSGSGKSTISNILLRMYDISSGLILIDGSPIGSLSSKWLRDNITVVEQQSVLFNTSIKENILLGSNHSQDTVSDKEMDNVIDFAMLQNIIDSSANGIDTVVGIGGSKLSGGQRQRVALARARIRDTPILILDESVSALDAMTRESMMIEIRKWRKNKTTIVITHELTQINDYDYVYVLDNGKTISQGARWLLDKNSNLSNSLNSPLSPSSPTFSLADGRPQSSIEHSPFSDFFDIEEKEAQSPEMHKRLTMPINLDQIINEKQSFGTPIQQTIDETQVGYSQFRRQSVFRPQSALYFVAPVLESLQDNGSYKIPDHSQAALHPSKVAANKNTSAYNIRKSRYLASNPSSRKPSFQTNQEQIFIKYISSSESSTYQVSAWYMMSMCYKSIKHKWLLWLGIFASIVNGGLTPVFSFIISHLLSQMTPGLNSNKSNQNKWISLALCIALFDGITAFARTLILGTVGDLWIKDLRKKATQAIVLQDMNWYTRNKIDTNDLTALLMSNAEDMRVLITALLNVTATTASLSVICVIWVMLLGWRLCLVGIAMVPMFYLSSMFSRYILLHWEGKCIFLSAIIEEIIHETVAGIRTLRILGLEKVFVSKFDKAVKNFMDVKVLECLYSGLGYGVGEMIPFITQGIILWYGMKLIADHTYPAQNILTVFTILFFCISSVGTLLTAIPTMHHIFLTGFRLFQILDFKPEFTQEKAGTQSKIRITSGSIVFSNVHFSYVSPKLGEEVSSPAELSTKRQKVKALFAPQATKEDDHLLIKVLNSFTAVIPGHKTTAIVGPSGSGKSTIVSLITKLFTPTGGSIKIDGVDILDIDTDILRQEIAVVGQMPIHFFGGTIYENITFALNRPVTLDEVRQVCQECAIDDFISNLPSGYNTLIGGSTGPVSSGGTSLLSGGQMQRIGIARALIRRPRLLILDECTSGLDQASTNAIKDTLKAYRGKNNITILIITHQEDVASMADVVITVSEGKVVNRTIAKGEVV